MGTRVAVSGSLILLILPIDSAVARQLIDKIYEKRKAAALELEKKVAYRLT
jgi:hypothetical protein